MRQIRRSQNCENHWPPTSENTDASTAFLSVPHHSNCAFLCVRPLYQPPTDFMLQLCRWIRLINIDVTFFYTTKCNKKSCREYMFLYIHCFRFKSIVLSLKYCLIPIYFSILTKQHMKAKTLLLKTFSKTYIKAKQTNEVLIDSLFHTMQFIPLNQCQFNKLT